MNYVIITGLFVGPLCIMRSHRWTCSVGIFLMGVGVILSSFAKTSIDLYLSSGLIAGKILLIKVLRELISKRPDKVAPTFLAGYLFVCSIKSSSELDFHI